MRADGTPSRHDLPGDTCVEGMALAYCAYFSPDDPRVGRLARHLLSCQKPDGGFTWDNRSDAGEAHTTICVLEGLGQCLLDRPDPDLRAAWEGGAEFLLSRWLLMDEPDARFRRLSYPWRYRYDLLRALSHFADLALPPDPRLEPALDWLRGKRRPDGRWLLENVYPGNVHFQMEERGEPSRFLTLRALRVLR